MASVEPKLSRLVELRIVQAESAISNFSSLFARPDERLELTCSIEAPQQTDFVYWYKNKEPIQYDKLRNSRRFTSSATGHRQQQVVGESEEEHRKRKELEMFHSQSSLIIRRVQLNDTANYTCLVSTFWRSGAPRSLWSGGASQPASGSFEF